MSKKLILEITGGNDSLDFDHIVASLNQAEIDKIRKLSELIKTTREAVKEVCDIRIYDYSLTTFSLDYDAEELDNGRYPLKEPEFGRVDGCKLVISGDKFYWSFHPKHSKDLCRSSSVSLSELGTLDVYDERSEVTLAGCEDPTPCEHMTCSYCGQGFRRVEMNPGVGSELIEEHFAPGDSCPECYRGTLETVEEADTIPNDTGLFCGALPTSDTSSATQAAFDSICPDTTVNVDDVIEATNDLIEAAKVVVKRWESGNLAEAVNNLNVVIGWTEQTLDELAAHKTVSPEWKPASVKPINLAIVLDGGLVQAVVTDTPEAFKGINTMIIDYDVDAPFIEDDTLGIIPQPDGGLTEAHIQKTFIDHAGIDLSLVNDFIKDNRYGSQQERISVCDKNPCEGCKDCNSDGERCVNEDKCLAWQYYNNN